MTYASRRATATRRVATDVVPADAYGFTIAHDARSAGLAIVSVERSLDPVAL